MCEIQERRSFIGVDYYEGDLVSFLTLKIFDGASEVLSEALRLYVYSQNGGCWKGSDGGGESQRLLISNVHFFVVFLFKF